MFTWDQEEIGHEMWLMARRSFPPAQGASAPGTVLEAKAKAGGSRQELLAPGVGRISLCLQACPMVLMGHLRALSL